MNRTLQIYLGILFLLIVGIVVFDSNRQKPVDWSPTFSLKDKIPYGMYVFDQEINGLLKGQKIEKFSTTPYEFFEPMFKADSIVDDIQIKGNFLKIAKGVDFDNESISQLFKFVSKGNSVFMSSENFSSKLMDSLKLEMDYEYNFKDSIYNWLANKKLETQKYKITEGLNTGYFSKIDTLKTAVLGYQSGDSSRVNFVKVKFQKGDFYLHLQPVAFSNFHLLKGNHDQYAQKVLSYLPKGNIYWNVQGQTGEIISQSPMRYILSQPALKWAWYVFLLGMLFFIFFNAKRKQRVVPIIKPLTNTTIEFAKTIGNLYYQEGDFNNIIDKKIIYFLEKVRNEYLMETNKLDNEFVKKLHLKSGKKLIDIQNLVQMINAYRRNRYDSNEFDLLQMNTAIEKIVS